LLRYTESVSEFLRREPFVKVRGIGVVEFLNQLLERLLLLERAVQLEQHVLHPEVVRNRTAIILRVCFTARVARKPDQLSFIDVLRDAGTRVPPHVNRLRVGRRDDEHKCQDKDGEGGKSRFSKHGSP
jgi:hypothetical protein